MIFHVLSEAEPFSEHFGGALSRWVANIIARTDEAEVICPWADDTWGFPAKQVCPFPALLTFVKINKLLRRQPPMRLRIPLLRYLFRGLTDRLKKGDVVYIHNRPEFAAAISGVCHAKGARLVLHLHNSHLVHFPEAFRNRLDADAVVYCSAFLKAEMNGLLPHVKQQSVLANGADDLVFYPRSRKEPHSGDFQILFVGRLVPEKGAHNLVKAMRILREKGVPVRARIIGSVGFGSSATSDYVERLKQDAPENVEFADYISGSRLGDEYRRADIFCCPSVWNEPFGLVNVEAMASGLPAIATRVGGIPEIFRDGGGILIQGDSTAELVAAIEKLTADPALRSELAAQGYAAFSRNYRWSEIRKNYLQLLQSLG
jgi:spore coat protein SA